jgi:hypothetical protein
MVEVPGKPDYMVVEQGDSVAVELPDGADFSVATLGDCSLVRCAGVISLVDDKGAEIHGLSVTFEHSPDPHNY